jgi:thiol-disulfide isomerase/thioredoxin
MSLKDLVLKYFGGGPHVSAGSLPVLGNPPEFKGTAGWLNSEPLDWTKLRGKVVLIDFWTFSCVNCLRTLPHIIAWHEAYADAGLAVIGIHTPEFEFERGLETVKAAAERLGVRYPVAVDDDYAVWNSYRNRCWPAHYFVDVDGRLRYRHFGEGAYGHSESVIRALLTEAGREVPAESVSPRIPPDVDATKVKTPETYLGWNRMEYLGSPETVRPVEVSRYSSVKEPGTNTFYLDGLWRIDGEWSSPAEAGAKIIFRFVASKVFLVARGTESGARATVKINGKTPAPGAKTDGVLAPDGTWQVTFREGKLYALADSGGDYSPKLLELAFLDLGAELYAFSFG